MNLAGRNKFGVLDFIGVSLFVILAGGCGSSAKKQDESLRTRVQSELKRVSESKVFDNVARKYVDECLASKDFRVRARVSPVLHNAVEIGAIPASEAEAKFREAMAKNPEDSEFWQAAIAKLHENKPKVGAGH